MLSLIFFLIWYVWKVQILIIFKKFYAGKSFSLKNQSKIQILFSILNSERERVKIKIAFVLNSRENAHSEFKYFNAICGIKISIRLSAIDEK